jgi:hypothetical protein
VFRILNRQIAKSAKSFRAAAEEEKYRSTEGVAKAAPFLIGGIGDIAAAIGSGNAGGWRYVWRDWQREDGALALCWREHGSAPLRATGVFGRVARRELAAGSVISGS